MPFVHLKTNVPKDKVNSDAVHAAIVKAVATALERPEKVVTSQVDLGVDMKSGLSSKPCATVLLTAFDRKEESYHAKVAEALTAAVSSALGISPHTVSISITDVRSTDFSMSGKLLSTLLAKL